MRRPVLLTVAAAAIALTVTACGDEGVPVAVPTTSSAVLTTAPTTAPAEDATAPRAPAPAAEPPRAAEPPAPAPESPPRAAEPPAPAPESPPTAAEPPAEHTPEPPAEIEEPAPTPPTADHCAEVTREYLITTLRMTGEPRYPLADLQEARCSGTFASAMSYPEGTLHPVMYLFEHTEEAGGWRVIDVGIGLDCVNRHGVPADAGRAIGCAS